MTYDDDEYEPEIPKVRARPPLVEYAVGRPPAIRCQVCGGTGCDPDRPNINDKYCRTCDSVGFLQVDPTVPTTCHRGTEGKRAVMAARYRHGHAIFRVDDHGGRR